MQVQRSVNEETKQIKLSVPNQKQSLNMVSNILTTTIGSISFIRGFFPSDVYEDLKNIQKSNMNNNNSKTPKTLSRNRIPEVDNLLNWVEISCMDAIQKRYLKSMTLEVYKDNGSSDKENCTFKKTINTEENSEPDNKPILDKSKLIESYRFEFSYPEEDKWNINLAHSEYELSKTNKNDMVVPKKEIREQIMNQTKGDIMQSTSQLLRRLLIMTSTLSPLPNDILLSMRLEYYQETTPHDYEPPLFGPSPIINSFEKSRYCKEEDKDNSILLGQAGSKSHFLVLEVHTCDQKSQSNDKSPNCNKRIKSPINRKTNSHKRQRQH